MKSIAALILIVVAAAAAVSLMREASQLSMREVERQLAELFGQ